jgi:hypothetical protein
MPWLLAEWAAGITYLVLAIWRDDRKTLFEAPSTHPLEVTSFIVALAAVLSLLFDHAMALFTGWPFDTRPEVTVVRFVPLGFAVAAWLLFAVLVLRTRFPAAVTRVMLAARQHEAPIADGSWGALVGTVEDPTPVSVSGEPAAVSRVMNHGKLDVVLDDTFVLKSSIGPVTVDPRDAIWTSTARRKVTGAGGYVLEEVPVGAKALVVGRASSKEGAPRIASTGPESLFLLAVPADQEPREVLELYLASRRRWLWVELAVSCGISLVAALAIYLA